MSHRTESSPAPSDAAHEDGEASRFRYYRHTGGSGLASRLSLRVRRRMFELFMREMRPHSGTRVLDLGVTSEDEPPESNYLERWYPYPDRIVCAGTQDAAFLEERRHGLRFVRIRAGEPLPFENREFDVVFSNAVVEHVGSTASQGSFVSEALRVARAFFVTTPNRWFPIELHTGLPLLHYLPPRAYRPLYRGLGFGSYATERALHLLDARSLRELFPDDVRVRVESVRLFGLPSNLIALGDGGGA